MTAPARAARRLATAVALAAGATLVASGLPASAASRPAPLPLGASKLPEKRTSRALATGVTHTTITRGSGTARPSQIATTANGPWRVNVVTVEPKKAKGRLQTTFGGDIGRLHNVQTTATWARALFGTNGGFFSLSRSRAYPGDPVGLAVHAGTVVSEPTRAASEQNVLIDATTMKLRMGHFGWTATARNPRSGAEAKIDAVNTALPVPSPCARLADPRSCTVPGKIARLQPQFARTTPAGPGAEIVLDRKGCIVRTALKRGTAVSGNQTTLQATGSDVRDLLALGSRGCLAIDEKVTDADGDTLKLGRDTYGLTGRYRLVAGGRIAAPTSRTSISGRNPRTFIGRHADGRVSVVTIDGRQVRSVGTTLTETARVAKALGLVDAVNLDGGGSTTLVVKNRVTNVPSGQDGQRGISDSLVFIPRR